MMNFPKVEAFEYEPSYPQLLDSQFTEKMATGFINVKKTYFFGQKLVDIGQAQL